MIRAVFCDLDGTLVRPGNQVLETDIETLREISDRGARLIFVTGRPARCLTDLPATLTRLTDEVVTSNGASEVANGQTRILAPLPAQHIHAFCAALRDADPKVSFATECESAFGFEPGYAWWPATDTGADAVCADITDLADSALSITKVLCRSSHLNVGDLAQRAEELGFDVTVTYSCRPQEGGPVEVLSPLASKGHAVRRILTEAGIAPTETVAFGDRTNDIPMLDTVGDGIAIGHPAEHVCPVSHQPSRWGPAPGPPRPLASAWTTHNQSPPAPRQSRHPRPRARTQPQPTTTLAQQQQPAGHAPKGMKTPWPNPEGQPAPHARKADGQRDGTRTEQRRAQHQPASLRDAPLPPDGSKGTT